MQQVWHFFIYIVICYVLAALLVFTLSIPSQFIQRIGILFVGLSFWSWLKMYGLANKATLGYEIKFTSFITTIIWGLCIGIVILACLVAMLIGLKVRYFTPGISLMRLPNAIVSGLLTGLIVASLEETFFRGALFAAIRQQNGNAMSAIIWSSLLYAALHFFKPQIVSSNSNIIIKITFSIMNAYYDIWRIHNLDAFIALLLAGTLLALIREHTKHLGWNIGIHAGWILIIKVSHIYTDVNVNSVWINLISSYDGIIGWLAAMWLGILVCCYAYWRYLHTYIKQ